MIPTPFKPRSRPIQVVMGSPYLGQCYLCGRQLRSRKWEVHVHGGGSFILTREESLAGSHGFEDGEDLGLQPVGSECIKDIPAECRFKENDRRFL